MENCFTRTHERTNARTHERTDTRTALLTLSLLELLIAAKNVVSVFDQNVQTMMTLSSIFEQYNNVSPTNQPKHRVLNALLRQKMYEFWVKMVFS